MSVTTDLQTAIESNANAIKQYAARLAEDSLDPKKSYTLDGEAVDRNAWRAGISDIIAKLAAANAQLQALLNQQDPYVISTRHYV